MKRLIILVALAGLLAGCADTNTTPEMGSTGAAMGSSGGGINGDRSSSASYPPTISTNDANAAEAPAQPQRP